jgi:very-short-patch-repair endonuclease
VRSLISTHDLIADAVAWLAQVTRQDADQLRRHAAAMTTHDFEWFWRNLPIPAEKALPAAACRLILAEACGKATPDRIAARLLDAMTTGRKPAGTQAVASLADLATPRGLPTLLLTPPGACGGAAWLAEAARSLTELAAAVPALPLAVAVEPSAAETLWRSGLPSRTLAVLREGLVPVESLSEEALADRLRAAGAAAGPSAAVRRLAQDGASEELVAAFADAARRVGPKAVPEEEEAARSAAERFLYERLESLAATAGLFRLNQELDFRHGPAAAEVDLVAASLRLAVELDGSYFHLRDPDSYRRDRRKDWELQRRGYLVLRFLSEDVVERLEKILDTILAAVELRRAPGSERGRPS